MRDAPESQATMSQLALAGWELIRFMPYGHGRSAKAIYAALRAPTDSWTAFARHWMLLGQWFRIVEAERKRNARADKRRGKAA